MSLMSWSKNTPHCVSWKCWDKKSKSKWHNTQRKAAVLHSSMGRQTVISPYIYNLFCEAETYPCDKGLHNGFAPLKGLKGGLQGAPNSSLHYAAVYITDHSCSTGEEPEAPSICPFAMVLNNRQGREHLRWAHSAAQLSSLPALSLWGLGDPRCQQASKQQFPGESLPP